MLEEVIPAPTVLTPRGVKVDIEQDSTSNTETESGTSSPATQTVTIIQNAKKKRTRTTEQKSIGQYALNPLDILGKGGFGVVYKAMNTQTAEFVAIKQIPLEDQSKESIQSVLQEIDLMKKLNHKHIVKYLDHKMTKNHLYIILEFIENGSLLDLIRKFTLPETLVAMYIKQVLEGLKYLHGEGVIHRDIKAANILITNKSVVKLADFGVATHLQEGKESLKGKSKNDQANSPAGTPYWMSPEIIEMKPPTKASDLWSVGCTVIELLTGEPPYYEEERFRAMYRIVNDPHPPLPPNISKACEDFLLQCFKKDPDMRKDSVSLLEHPWIKAVKPTVPLNTTPRERKVSVDDEVWGLDSPTPKKDEKKDFMVTSPDDSKVVDLTEERRKSEMKAMVKDVKFDKILAETNLRKFKETDDEDFGTMFKGAKSNDLVQKLKALKNDEVSDHTLVEHNIMKQFESITTQEVEKDQFSEIEKQVLQLFQIIKTSKKENEVLTSCTNLKELFKVHPYIKTNLNHNGVLPILELIEISNDQAILGSILQVVNAIIFKNPVLQETLCLIGALPTITNFSSHNYNKDIRLEVAHFIREIVYTSSLTIQMFVACRGLPVLVEFLEHPEAQFWDYKDIIFTGIDGVIQVFRIPLNTIRTPKNDFCRIFTKSKIMNPLSKILSSLVKNKNLELNSLVDENLTKIMTIILLFSEGDSIVKQHISEENILKIFIEVVQFLKGTHKEMMLKTFKNLTLDTKTFQSLEIAGAIPMLVSCLGDSSKQVSHQALNALFSLCLVNPKRQEIAAGAGCIPHLQNFIVAEDPLHKIALDMICDMARAKKARKELWKNNGVAFYIQLLSKNKWKGEVLESLYGWLVDDKEKSVQDEMMKSENLNSFLIIFEQLDSRVLITILVPLLKLITSATRVNDALGRSFFINVLIKAIEENINSQETEVRLNLLKLISTMYKYCTDPKRFAGQMNLYAAVKKMSLTDSKVLVTETAKALLKAFDENAKV